MSGAATRSTAVVVQTTVPAPGAASGAGTSVARRRPSVRPARGGGATLLSALLEAPTRFAFDAAVSILLRAARRGRPDRAIAFAAPVGLGFPHADAIEVAAEGAGRFRLVPGLIGLTGPAGALPRVYTAHVMAERRRRSRALADFLDLLAQRPIAQFAEAGIKYRPHRAAEVARLAAGEASGAADPALGERGAIEWGAIGQGEADPVRDLLLALTGHGLPRVAAGLGGTRDAVLFFAGAFATRPRTAERLGAILADWLGMAVTVEQFAGRWLRLGEADRSVLGAGAEGGPTGGGGRFDRLGVDAAAGAAAWDIQSRVVLRVGPLPLDRFRSMLPGAPLLAAMVSLARAYLDGAAEFAVNPVLAASAVPPVQLGGEGAARLGWDAWMPVAGGRRADAGEAVFDAASIGEETGRCGTAG